MIDYIQIGNRVRSYRKQKGLTQESLAFEIHTSAAYISCIERGTKKPSLQKLVEIAEILDVSVESLVYGNSQGIAPPGDPEVFVREYPDHDSAHLLNNLTEIISILKLTGRY